MAAFKASVPIGSGANAGSLLSASATCISPVRLGDAQIATFAYFGDMHFEFSGECDVILRQDRADFGEPSAMSRYVWRLVWEGRRVADRDERFRLYERIERPTTPVKRRGPRRRTVD